MTVSDIFSRPTLSDMALHLVPVNPLENETIGVSGPFVLLPPRGIGKRWHPSGACFAVQRRQRYH